MYALFRLYEREFDGLFMVAFSEDTCRIASALDEKKEALKMNNLDTKLKLSEIDKKLAAFGGSLNSSVVDEFNTNLSFMLS
jgi:hypothetical protein